MEIDTQVLVATISPSASIVIAVGTYLLTKYRKRADEWRKQKLEHYSEILESISEIVGDDVTTAGQRRFTTASNTIGLVASQDVITCLNEFRHAIQNPTPDPPDDHVR